jgi:hypothetical protein
LENLEWTISDADGDAVSSNSWRAGLSQRSRARCSIETVLSPSTWPNPNTLFSSERAHEERVLEARNEAEFTGLANCWRDTRHPHGPRQHPLWRLGPDRWLESLVVGRCKRGGWATGVVMPIFSGSGISACDRAMIDVLAVTHAGRLAVVERKADEDTHLPLQGLDYWSRVEWPHARSEFPRALLRYLAPEIEWELWGVTSAGAMA